MGGEGVFLLLRWVGGWVGGWSNLGGLIFLVGGLVGGGDVGFPYGWVVGRKDVPLLLERPHDAEAETRQA